MSRDDRVYKHLYSLALNPRRSTSRLVNFSALPEVTHNHLLLFHFCFCLRLLNLYNLSTQLFQLFLPYQFLFILVSLLPPLVSCLCWQRLMLSFIYFLFHWINESVSVFIFSRPPFLSNPSISFHLPLLLLPFSYPLFTQMSYPQLPHLVCLKARLVTVGWICRCWMGSSYSVVYNGAKQNWLRK